MQQKYTVLYRVWHWLMAISVIGLLLTVLLRKTFLSYKTNALIIQEKLASMDIDISIENAKIIGKAIRTPMWEWHYIFGAMLGISLLIHLYMIITKRMSLPCLALIKAQSFEERMKKGVYFLIFIGIVIMSITGGTIYFYKDLGLTKENAQLLKELHESLLYPMLTVVVLHWIGVFRHEVKTKESIISKMVHGE
ncbi:cytochrome b/b6 domain-containing protein [Sulfurimonas sp. C5]|uniref:cytochrome b/b6 domain-containing protein n=1 Tax=Sulfurimonas sp. C5 TaxID=3036947 RepID=UPI0024590C93|nr:cytochrome b/b6 domain-containing protein [Sulfurimonas sp. C5]MDH4943691.1 cytochrome b/b6 domain-containing protein [Sulfurimonas sp. C5]